MKPIVSVLPFLLLIASCLPAHTQERVSSRFHFPNVLFKPRQEYATGSVLTARPEGVRDGTVWNVFAARQGVRGYANANQTGSSRSFDFMDSFVVVSETPNEVRAVHSDYVELLNLREGHESHTWWFKKADLLLWHNSLVQTVQVHEHEAEFNRRAMVINQLEMTVDVEAEPGFFDQPEQDARLISEARSFTVLFVYQEMGDFLLLGESPGFSRHNAKSRIRGWVNRQFLSEWHHHLALERNWEVVNRPGARIYSHLSDARAFATIPDHTPAPPGRVIHSESTPSPVRAIGEENRFFVLTESLDMEERYPKLGIVGDVHLDGFEGQSSACLPHPIPPERIAEIRRRVSRGIAAAQQVNVLFVVDATRSMEIYSEPIIEALETTMVQIMADSREREMDIQYHLGALVFRDEHEPVPYEVSHTGRWTSDVRIMRRFFESAMDPVKNTGANPTHPEALFHGMHRAIEIFQPDPLNTNYMILIGDAGDNPASYAHIQQQHVVDLLDAFNFNLLAYQIHHMDHWSGAYDAYRDEVSDIIAELSLKRNRSLQAAYEDFRRGCPDIEWALGSVFGQLPLHWTGFDVLDSLSHATIHRPKEGYTNIAQFTFPAFLDESITTREFGQMLRRDLTEIPRQLEAFLQMLNITGEASDDEMHTLSIIFFGLQLGLSLEDILILVFQFNEIYQEGYTAYHPGWTGMTPLFHFVAFINHNAAISIAEFFSRLIPQDAIVQPEQIRTRLYSVWQRILVEDLQLVPREDFHRLTLAQGITYLTGLPAPAAFSAYSFADLQNPARMSDQVLMTLCVDLIITIGQLNSLTLNRNVMDRSFFSGYFPYLDEYLLEKGLTQVNFRRLTDDLVNHFSRYAFADYPRKSINNLRPEARQYWYYWLDARQLPSVVSSPSDMVYRLGLQQ